MGLPWVRLDTDIFSHPKLLQLQEAGEYRAIVLHLKAMAYTGKHGLDGFIPDICLRMLGGSSTDAELDAQEDAKTLLDACLWTAQPGGYSMHGWEKYQAVSEETAARKKHAQKAAQARWAKRNGAGGDAH